MRRFIISLVAALALSTPALAQGTTTINNLPAANTPLYCSEVVASWQVYRTVKIPVALAGAVCQAATAPLSPFAGQQWWDTSAGAGLWSLRVYDGASWLPIGRLDTTAHVWTPATNQPVQTVTGASKTFAASDFQFDTRRSNSASAMTDTFPALAAGVNGARITVTNADASAGDTITAASGTTICGANSCGTTTVVPAGRSLAFVFDSANTAWRPSVNTATAVLGPTSTASGNLAAFTDTTGKVLTDSGVLPANVVQGPGSATSGNLASYNGTSGKLLADASVAVNQVVTLTGSQILTNKTLTAPVIGTIVNTGTLTLPTSTDTIVGRATTDTLTNKTLTAPVMTLASNTTSPTASQSAASFTGTILTGGTGTTNFPALFIQPTGTTAATTWNTGGTGLGMNLASGFAGNFLDFHVGGAASVFKVDSAGNATLNGDVIGLANASRFMLRNGNTILSSPGSAIWQLGAADASTATAQTIGVQSVVAGTTNTAGVTTTFRNSAGTGTGVGGNYVFQYAPHGTTGSTPNAWATGVTINGDTGALTSVGTVQGTTLNATVQIVAPASGPIYWSARSAMTSPSDGVIQFSNQGGSAFTALQLGGATASFPEIKRNATALNFRLADDSADAPITAAAATLSGTLTTNVTGGGTQCAQVSNTGVLSGSGAGCASAAPSAMMHLVSGDTIASNNTFVNITFDAIDFDTAGICSAVSHVCTPTTAGKYRVTCRTQLTAAGTVANSDHLSGVTARKNGASAPGMNFTAYASASGTGSLSEGEVNGIVTVNGSTDTIGCAANVSYTSFSSGTILGGGDNYLIISYVGP